MPELQAARELVADVLGCPDHSIDAETAVGSLPQWDSMAHVSIILKAEERLGRLMSSEEVASFTSVGSLASILSAPAGEGKP